MGKEEAGYKYERKRLDKRKWLENGHKESVPVRMLCVFWAVRGISDGVKPV